MSRVGGKVPKMAARFFPDIFFISLVNIKIIPNILLYFEEKEIANILSPLFSLPLKPNVTVLKIH